MLNAEHELPQIDKYRCKKDRYYERETNLNKHVGML
jgi:hypothetical protein